MAGQATPGAARVIDPILTTIAQGYKNAGLVGMALFPAVPVGQRGGKIIQFGKEAFELYNTARSPGAATKRVQYGYASQGYSLVDYSMEGQVPQELQQEAEAVPGIDLASGAIANVQDINALQLEVAQATLATTAGNYGAGSKNTSLASTTLWSDLTNSDPIGNSEDAKEAIRSQIGLRPDTVIMGPKVIKALRQHSKIIDRTKYTGRDVPTTDLIASLLGVKQVLVGEAIYSDQSGNFVDIWGKNVVFAYTGLGTLADRGRPSYGYTYRLRNYPVVEAPYFERNTKSWLYPVSDSVQPVMASSLAGFLISPAVA